MEPRTRRPEDERFVESFKHYVEDLIVEESVHEINGWKAVPKERFEEAGNRLIEDAEAVGISEAAEKLVGQVNALAEYGMLAPEPGTCYPEGTSIQKVVTAVNGFRDYFGNAGLEIFAGEDSFMGRPVVKICLGEAKTVDVEPELVIFTKMVIEDTASTMANRSSSKGVTCDWTDGKRTYYPLKPKLENGKVLYDRLQSHAAVKISLAAVGRSYSQREVDKLEELIWSPLLWKCKGDAERFSREFATTCVEHNHPHETYHALVAKGRQGSWAEAAAQLHSMSSPFANPLGALSVLYEWKEGSGAGTYSYAAEIAFRQLELAGYDKSIWEKLEPEDADGIDTASVKLKGLAAKALENIEEVLQIARSPELEEKLGRSYRKLHGELQKLEDVNYGG